MKITNTMQKVAADILTEFLFTSDMDDVIAAYDRVFQRYGLCDDPFTGCPCTPEEYCESQLEYEKQTMIAKYGHCNGLE
jgi:hypothetical protein